MPQRGTALNDKLFDLAVDEDGSVILVGTTDNETSSDDFSVIKLDPLGNELWRFEVGPYLDLGSFPLASPALPPVS